MFPTRLSLVDFAKKSHVHEVHTCGGRNTGTNCKDSLKKWSIGTLQRFQKILNGIFWSGLHKYRPRKDFDDQMILKTSSFFSRKRE